MSKEEVIIVTGTIEEVMPSTMFKVRLDELDAVVLGYLSGRMRQNKIRVLLGDKVELELSSYDLSRGRITRRT